MRAIDSNVVLRFLLRDHARQSETAARIIADGVFVPLTVILETHWVLSSRYGLSRDDIREAFDLLFSLDSVVTPDPEGLGWALDRYAEGADLEDMVHLVAARATSAFATFDRGIEKAAGDNPPVVVETL